jgi:hypothetical protein
MNLPGASLKALAFAVTLATASMANASTTDFGTIAPGSTFSTYVSTPRLGVFEDFYTFSLMTTGVSEVIRSITFTIDDDLTHVSSGFIGLTRGLFSAATDAEVNWTAFDIGTKKYSYTGLGAGDYYFKVGGEGWKESAFVEDPKYNAWVSISAAPVPEPETYAMLFAGLGIMGTVVRRRSRSL